jgi:hypothetical protein
MSHESIVEFAASEAATKLVRIEVLRSNPDHDTIRVSKEFWVRFDADACPELVARLSWGGPVEGDVLITSVVIEQSSRTVYRLCAVVLEKRPLSSDDDSLLA